MIAADRLLDPGRLPGILRALSRGEVVAFGRSDEGPAAFSVQREGHSFVLRCPRGRALASAATFAEVWREQPK